MSAQKYRICKFEDNEDGTISLVQIPAKTKIKDYEIGPTPSLSLLELFGKIHHNTGKKSKK